MHYAHICIRNFYQLIGALSQLLRDMVVYSAIGDLFLLSSKDDAAIIFFLAISNRPKTEVILEVGSSL
jgi:hypothetical protein